MLTTHLSREQQAKFDQQVNQSAAKLRPDVVGVRYNFGEDWSGAPSVFFRIVLSDKASRYETLADVTGRVRSTLFGDLGFAELDYTPYFSFRSEADQRSTPDPAWP